MSVVDKRSGVWTRLATLKQGGIAFDLSVPGTVVTLRLQASESEDLQAEIIDAAKGQVRIGGIIDTSKLYQAEIIVTRPGDEGPTIFPSDGYLSINILPNIPSPVDGD